MEPKLVSGSQCEQPSGCSMPETTPSNQKKWKSEKQGKAKTPQTHEIHRQHNPATPTQAWVLTHDGKWDATNL